jgi:membrane dipeptidase
MNENMKIIDMHCDTLLESWYHPEQSLYDGPTTVNLKLMKEAGSLCQCFAMFLPWKRENIGPYEIMKGIYSTYLKKLESHKDIIRPAYSAEDILNNRDKGFLSSLLTVEDAAFLEGKKERMDEAYEMGVRMISLTWNYENCVAYPNNHDDNLHKKGLKVFGMEMVEKMNDLGIIVDCSHLSEGGFYDVAKISKKPFACSHSCARSLCDHPRNLTDDQLKTLGEAGGIVGVNFYGAFLNNDAAAPSYARIIDHLLYMKDKAGIDAVGFGSDLDGIDDYGEIVNYGGFSTLLERMQNKFTDDEIDKISHLNALRVIKANVGK